MRNHVVIFVNGQLHRVTGSDVFLSLAEFLRTRRMLTGTKVVCSEGDCGSCSVLVGRIQGDSLSYLPVDSCIQFVFQLDGAHVVTVEGLSRDGQLSTVQQAMVDHHGSQCGFCTPGFVTTMTALASESEAFPDTTIDWRTGLTGNLCRCTGYEPIIAAGHAIEESLPTPLNELYPPAEMLESARNLAQQPFEVQDSSSDPQRQVVSPIALPDVVVELRRLPGATLVAGATDLGVQCNNRRIAPNAFIDLNRVRELTSIHEQCDGESRSLCVGAGATWTQVLAAVKHNVPELHRILLRFGSPQIRHVGTVGGNLANASPIADSVPFLMVMEAEIELLGPAGSRRVNINQFYQGYKQMDLQPNELIAAVHIPLPQSGDTLRLFKVSRRRDLDISTMTAAIRMRLNGNTIEASKVAFGGVGPVVMRAAKTEHFLAGRQFTEDTMRQAGDEACKEITPITDVRGSAEFRYQLTQNVLLKFFHEQRRE